YTLNVIYTGFPDHINLTRCYVTGMVNCTLKADYNPYVGQFDTQGAGLPPVLSNCYYDEQMLPLITSKNGALKTSEMTGTAPKLEGFSADTWTFTANLYPRLTSVATNQAAYVSAAAILLADTTQTVEAVTTNFNVAVANSVKWYASIDGKNGTAGHTLDITQNTGEVVLNGGVGVDTLIAQNGNITKYVFIKVSPASQFEGAGTEDSPFLIRNKEDLIRLSTITFDNKMSYNGVYFKLTNDIDLENDPAFKGIAANGTNSTYAFGGILDGDNHTIHNLRMVTCPLNDEKKTTNTTSNCGFINNMKVGGVVKNLRIADDCYFEMYSRSAAIVGYNYGGTIENCRNYATVIAHSGNVGAMTGYNGDGGVIRGCYNAGKITAGYQYVGGICANNRGIIENCQNDGEVSVEHINEQYVATRGNTAGGIAVANFGTMSNVLNTGYIHAPKYVGGIMAWFNNKNGQIASNAVNVGIIDFDAETGATEAGTIGNIVGKMYQVGTAQNCYYDGQLSIYDAAHSASHDGMTALTTAQLTAGESLAGLTAAHRSPANSELDATYWVFEKGKYPMLKAFADEAGAKAASLSVAYFAQNTRSDSIKRDVELNVADGLSWTLAGGQQAFEIKEGYTLWMDPAAELADTLIATCGKFVKRIPIVATPDTVPLPTMEVTNAAQNIVTFADDLEGVTFYYTTDGSLPTAAGKSTTGDAQLDAGTYVVTVIGTKHNYYPSEPASFNVTMTGVDGVQTASEVISVRYINVAGIESDKPFSGVNIVVTTHADGSQTATKVIF
ncbi:MAG: hypothetical protein IJ808_03825, partial [Muribaculaceae bacterium]|nr:hypothetical protein [Muribaculaceae bacterium]